MTHKNTHLPEHLKIMIVSTPKTGNTWLKNLLSNIYDLPIVGTGAVRNFSDFDTLGERWVTHQHYALRTELVEWARRSGVIFLTTIRHPGDVLASLFHYVSSSTGFSVIGENDPVSRMRCDGGVIGEHSLAYVKESFHALIDVSLAWIRSGVSRSVRYEDLWRDPMCTLQNLTAVIGEVSLDRIERAVELCDIDLMRRLPDGDPRFFRKGTVGNWKQELPPEIIDTLRRTDPYPAQFAELGYTLDPDDALTTLPRKPRLSQNPFRDISHFDNGIVVPPIAVKLYLSLDTARCSQFSDEEHSIDLASFYSWLNAPADEDPQRREETPIVTNLAYYVYRTRRDLQSVFTDVFGKNRIEYVGWFATYAPDVYDLDDAFTRPMRDALSSWGAKPAEEDPHKGTARPLLTNLAIYIHHADSAVRTLFPDPFTQDRAQFAWWFLENAYTAYTADKALDEAARSSAQVIVQSFSNNPFLENGRFDNEVKVPAIAIKLYLLADVTLKAQWHGAATATNPSSFFAWLNAPTDEDAQRSDTAPVITNLAAYIHHTRPDLQEAFPHLYEKDRAGYAHWFIEYGKVEHQLDDVFISPMSALL